VWSKLFGGGEGLPREKVDAVVIIIEGWTAEQAQEVKGTIPDAASLDKPVSSEDKALRLVDVIVDEMHLDVPDAVIEVIEVTWLREAIQRLPQKARYVLVRRYGLDDRDTLTLAELASELKLSREAR
jgi:RNA polymerase primary sigma factor